MRSFFGALLVLSFGLVLFDTVGVVWILSLTVGASIVYILLGKGPPSRYLGKLDDLVYAGEKAIVCIALILMSAMVFFDVVWRNLNKPGSRLAIAVGVFVLCIGAGLSARRENEVPTSKKVIDGLIAFAIIFAAGFAITLIPNGFSWASGIAIAMLLWVGLLGASMATHDGRHIAVDIIRRIAPKETVRGLEVAGGLFAVALCALLTDLSITYASAEFMLWVDSEGTAGVFETVPIPSWTALISIPIGFGIMGVRFVGVTINGPKDVDLIESLSGGADTE